MVVSISELYGKRIITLGGRIIGNVKGVMLNFETGEVSHLLLDDADKLMRSSNLRSDFIKNSVAFKRVRKVTDTIVVSDKE
ncbi:MAG: PRC-barrel domain-containing protein [Candidatus Micrarchaeota archaeon]|nr:PRC-barrel domain-containing protein [Candidatus Micrarchaeota archaeon]MDE1859050.1 PRC-barrel domain-containing protein [Candidatus Micrarchaeota archaeon]